ncbi:MAG: tail fiber protein [Acidobacteria bacterium]|nr:tail fiber protein [Acidobacteriota bacterium]
MSTPFLGEIKIVSFNFPPKGWALCNGQFLPINQNQALFSLLGTTYGGNGQTTFALPNLRGDVPIHVGNGHILGEAAGEAAHTLTMQEMPQHTHTFFGTAANTDQPVPNASLLGTVSNVYTGLANLTTLHPASIGNTGGSQPHNNMMPYLVLNFIIALQGIFPSQN